MRTSLAGAPPAFPSSLRLLLVAALLAPATLGAVHRAAHANPATECSGLTFLVKFEADPDEEAPAGSAMDFGATQVGDTATANGVTITITHVKGSDDTVSSTTGDTGEAVRFTWTSSTAISRVVVASAGTNPPVNLDPPATSGSGITPSSNGDTPRGISHITFCTGTALTYDHVVDKHVSTDGTTWVSGEAADTDRSTVPASVPAVDEGDTVHFRLTVTNTGTGDLDGIVVDDSVANACETTITSLPASAPTWTCTYTTTAGTTGITNTVSATDGDRARSDTAAYTVNDVGPTYGLQVVKHVSPDAGTTWYSGEAADDDGATATAGVPEVDQGDTVHFRLTVTNTGTGDLGGIVVDDSVANDCETTITSLPASAPTWTCTYTTTAGAPGSYTNTATVSSLEEQVAAASDTAAFTVAEPFVPDRPSISLTNTPDVTSAGIGDTITYTYVVTNTGNVALSGLALGDDVLGTIGLNVAALATGASTTATATHTVTEADLPGPLVNVATVTAQPGSTGLSLLSVSTAATQVSATDDANVDLVTAPSIQVTKTSSTSGADVGDTVTYSYVVTNTGDVTLTDVVAVDDLLGDVPLGSTTLAPGASTGGGLSYVVVESDLPGPIVNVVTATGTPPVGDDVSDDDDAFVSLSSDPAITLEKTADVEADAEGLKVVQFAPNDGDDETVGYTYLVTNTGDVTLTDLTLVDDVLGDIALDVTALAPGQSATATATHVISQADADARGIENVAVVTGTGPDGTEVEATDDEFVFVESVLGLIVDRPDTPGAGPLPAPGPAPAPVAPTHLPATGADAHRLWAIAVALLALGTSLVLSATTGVARRGELAR